MPVYSLRNEQRQRLPSPPMQAQKRPRKVGTCSMQSLVHTCSLALIGAFSFAAEVQQTPTPTNCRFESSTFSTVVRHKFLKELRSTTTPHYVYFNYLNSLLEISARQS